MTDPSGLEGQVRKFADEVTARIFACLEGEPRPNEIQVVASPEGGRFTFKYVQTLLASVRGPVAGMLETSFALGPDRSGRYLAVLESSFKLKDRRGNMPILRVEYVRDARSVPCSHIHLHAQSGYLTQLLATAGHKTPAAVESIHIPTGGDRFRPCIEDFVEFLIEECKVAGREGWREEVLEGREKWRGMQTAAAVRDRPEVARRVLESMGLTVDGDLPADRLSARDRY